MTIESKKKANPDYTESAVNLCNPPEVQAALNLYYQLEKEKVELAEKLEATELFKEYSKLLKKVQEQYEKVKEAVKAHGSYQDTENGAYAIQQRRLSITFIPEQARIHIPAYSEALIEEVVNGKKVAGLLKGGLITEEQVKAMSETKETFAFIVK